MFKVKIVTDVPVVPSPLDTISKVSPVFIWNKPLLEADPRLFAAEKDRMIESPSD